MTRSSNSFRIAVAGPTTATKWNPGFYMETRTDGQWQMENVASFLDDPHFKNNPKLKGATFGYRWRVLENTRGDYTFGGDPSKGRQLVAGHLELLRQLHEETGLKKVMVLRVYEKGYPGGIDASNWEAKSRAYFPDYLVDAGLTYCVSPHHAPWKIWDETAVEYYLDMMSYYGEQFDDHPYFYMVGPWSESSLPKADVGTGGNLPDDAAVAGYTNAAILTQYKRLVTGLRAAFPASQVWASCNWTPYPVADQVEYYLHCEQQMCGSGNTDTIDGALLADSTSGQDGLYCDVILRGARSGTQDMRGRIPICLAVEDTSLGYRAGSPGWDSSALAYFNWVNDTMRADHWFISRNVYVGRDDQRWTTSGGAMGGILTTIRDCELANKAMPSCFEARARAGRRP